MNTLTKVEVGLSTYVGFGLAVLGYAVTLVNFLASNSNLLHVSPAVWVTISTAIAGATLIGRQIQAALQNVGVATAGGLVPAPTEPASPIVVPSPPPSNPDPVVPA
jgi:hypothetical protein